MIGSIRAGGGFATLAGYLEFGSGEEADGRRERGEGRLTACESDHLAGIADPALCAEIMVATVEALNDRVERPCLHILIAPSPRDRDAGRVTDEFLMERGRQTLADLGLSAHQVLRGVHRDTDVPHLHMMVNAVHPETGRVWDDWRAYARLERSLRAQEVELGLEVVPGKHAPVPERVERAADHVHDRADPPARAPSEFKNGHEGALDTGALERGGAAGGRRVGMAEARGVGTSRDDATAGGLAPETSGSEQPSPPMPGYPPVDWTAVLDDRKRRTELRDSRGEERASDRSGESAAHAQPAGDRVRIAADLVKQADGWDEASRHCESLGVRYERRGAGAVLATSDGTHETRVSRFGRGLSPAALETRFGESLEQWQARAWADPVARSDRTERLTHRALGGPPPQATPAAPRAPLTPLSPPARELADGLEHLAEAGRLPRALHRAREDAQIAEAALKCTRGAAARLSAAAAKFQTRLANTYTDAPTAEVNVQAYARAHGAEATHVALRNTPELFGELHGTRRAGPPGPGSLLRRLADRVSGRTAAVEQAATAARREARGRAWDTATSLEEYHHAEQYAAQTATTYDPRHLEAQFARAVRHVAILKDRQTRVSLPGEAAGRVIRALAETSLAERARLEAALSPRAWAALRVVDAALERGVHHAAQQLASAQPDATTPRALSVTPVPSPALSADTRRVVDDAAAVVVGRTLREDSDSRVRGRRVPAPREVRAELRRTAEGGALSSRLDQKLARTFREAWTQEPGLDTALKLWQRELGGVADGRGLGD